MRSREVPRHPGPRQLLGVQLRQVRTKRVSNQLHGMCHWEGAGWYGPIGVHRLPPGSPLVDERSKCLLIVPSREARERRRLERMCLGLESGFLLRLYNTPPHTESNTESNHGASEILNSENQNRGCLWAGSGRIELGSGFLLRLYNYPPAAGITYRCSALVGVLLVPTLKCLV